MSHTIETAWNAQTLQGVGISRDQILNEAERRLGVRLKREGQTPGNSKPSIGMPTQERTWVRLNWYQPGSIFSRELSGLEESLGIQGVPRSEFIQACHWTHAGVIFRAEEMTLAEDPAACPRSTPTHVPDVDAKWWEDLTQALENLSDTTTRRVSLPPGPIVRDLKKHTGLELETRTWDWVVGHGDLHWGNLTAPRLCILDWECWGRLPRGADPATLWACSFFVPELADEVQRRFHDDLFSPEGRACMLWASYRLLRPDIEERHGPEQLERLRSAQEDLIESLS
ncbi:hypothetical protein AB0I72_16510 [Nocardiopsis sp. NPDC049922]|uniref:hypothetical protein n=1 Tax=Nocardiopsis sp. NPDC049922 TaxID=3155157 RepID=UPI0033D44561